MQTSYGEDFYEGMIDSNLASARALLPHVFAYVKPTSVVDVGCGQGLWLRAFMEAGIQDIDGFDGAYVERDRLHIPQERFHATNLEENIRLARTYDMAVCLEVAEHVSDAKSRQLIESLTNAAPVVLFSAAIPGQGGVHHVNEQWPDYWRVRFEERGYIPVDCLRMKVWNDERVMFFYAQNIMFYVRNDALENYPRLKEEVARGLGQAPALVHPNLYSYYEERWNNIAPLIWKIPLPLIKFGKKLLRRRN